MKEECSFTPISDLSDFFLYHVFHPFTDGKVKELFNLRQVVCIFDEMHESKLNLFFMVKETI